MIISWIVAGSRCAMSVVVGVSCWYDLPKSPSVTTPLM